MSGTPSPRERTRGHGPTRRPIPPALGVAGVALVVGVGYYVGANIGFLLRLPPATPSVLWPPNTILTATLLLAPTRRWWIYLLAALPAHLVAELGVGWPPALVAALFATNCLEALLAAGGVRAFSDVPARFDTLRRVTVFIVMAAVVAPGVSSFADAAAVTALRHEAYWVVWRTRFFSNVLTELTLAPALVMAISAGPAWIRRASHGRYLEATGLAVGMLVVGIVAYEGPSAISRLLRVPIAYLLPFLLWAAVRFGPGGVSLAVLATALVAIHGSLRGRGPFTVLPLDEHILALQIYLAVAAIPLLCLAALVEERRQAGKRMEERLRFEALLSRLSGAFVHPPSHEMHDAIDAWLRRLGDFFELDRLALIQLASDAGEPASARVWRRDGPQPVTSVVPGFDVPRPILGGQSGAPVAPSPADVQVSRAAGGSDLTIPLVASDRVLGSLTFSRLADRHWSDEVVQRMRLVAEVFANALTRKDADDALRASEAIKAAILTSLSSHVAVLDREGRIIAVNESWTRFAREQALAWGAPLDVGASYLDLYRRGARDASEASQTLAGIEAVLDGSRAGYTHEYASRASGTERWFAMSVVPLKRAGGGAIVSHTEVTERKRVELDAQRSRQQLSHFTRVSTMGELAASLVHELSQPLTGILANAQAARRFLDSPAPDLGEVRSGLEDIVKDDRRAAEVIQRLRALLVKGKLERTGLDLHALIRHVVKLLGSDAIIRNVSITLDLATTAVVVIGDDVQLQQVVLNLVLNGMDAIVEEAVGDRAVVVRTDIAELHTVRVSVEDGGAGLRAGTEERVFEPFYTTKRNGMGMGLAIARSIIEAHGGKIWARNNPVRPGATFHFTLPVTDLKRV